MLSADVPEFVPRAYQNIGSPSNTATSKPEGRTLPPQQSTSTSRAYQSPPSSRFGLTRAPESSWREGREAESGLSHNFPKQNNVWRRSGKESGSWREDQTHEVSRHGSGTETLPKAYSGPPKMSGRQIVQKDRGRGKPVSTEDLGTLIRNKFVTTSKNMTHSYTRILKNNPKNSKPEVKPSKHDFSLSIDSQWPTLGGVQPQNMSNQSSESVKIESITNPWVCRSNEASPAKGPTTNPQNPWQERSATEPSKSVAVRPKNPKEHHSPSEDAVKTKQGILKLQRSAEMKSSVSNSRRLEGTRRHAPTNLCDVDPNIQGSNARNASRTEDNNSSGICKPEETVKVTKNSTTDEDSDPFQWKVIGEKKKKVKIKEEEVHGSLRLQELRGDDKKFARNLPDKPSSSSERKQAQEYSGKVTKNAVVSMLNNEIVHSSSSHETLRENKKDLLTLKSCPKEGKKSRPTKVASLANCRSDTREIRSTAKKSTAVVATKPVDEETLQRKAAAKLLKQKEKRKIREMKAQQALVLNRPKDTRVSLITTDFLEKTQTCNHKTHNQMSGEQTFHLDSSGHEGMAFTSEEYPALQIQRNTTRSLPLNRITQPKTTHCPNKSNKKMLSTQVNVQGDDSVPRYNKADNHRHEKGAVASEEHATTYRTALLAAKDKETNLMPAPNSTEVDDNAPTETVLQKKKVRTTDRIELDLFALAAHTGKKKKKELLADEYSPTKRKLQEEKSLASKTGLVAHSLLNKGAAVVAKRGKISMKPKKKKISRIKKCQMEKSKRDILALQLLLEKAKLITAQQRSLEVPPTTHIETEESCKQVDLVENNPTNELCSSTFMTEEDQEKDDDKKRQSATSEMKERETEDEENKENTRTSEIPCSTLNTNSQINNKTSNGSDDRKPKIIWVLNKTGNSIAQNAAQSTNSGMKAESNGEDKPSDQQFIKEGSPTSPASPAHKELLMNDPLVVQRASELISFVKSQSISQKGAREYIHQVVTPEVNAVAKELMKSLIAFQARHYQRDPVRARIKRRYVCGLKETTKLMGKMSCVIMAPNIEQCEGPGSLDDAVEKLLNQAEKHKVPVVFALSMRVLKKLCHKNGKRVSCFGIINYQGAQDHFKRLMELLPEAQKQYQQLVACGQCSLPTEGDEEKEEEEEDGEEDKEGRQEVKKDLTEIIARTNALLMAP